MLLESERAEFNAQVVSGCVADSEDWIGGGVRGCVRFHFFSFKEMKQWLLFSKKSAFTDCQQLARSRAKTLIKRAVNGGNG
jgi:hypothetical protein